MSIQRKEFQECFCLSTSVLFQRWCNVKKYVFWWKKKIEKKVGHNRLSCQHKSTAVTTIWLQSSLNTLHIVTILQRCDNLGLLTRETKESGFFFFCSVRRVYNRLIQNLSRNTLKLSLAEEMTRLHPIIRDLDLYWTGVTPLYIVSPQTQWHNSPITAH